MNLSILWSELAEEDIDKNLEYVRNKWGVKTANDFLDRVEETLDAVKSDPETYLQIDYTRRIYKFIVNAKSHSIIS